MIKVNIKEAKVNLSTLIDKVTGGEEVYILKEKKPLVKLIPIEELKGKRKLGTAIGKVFISDDFDEPLTDFINYYY